jgi:hypothetical protein
MGYRSVADEIVVREDAPLGLRKAVLLIAEECGLRGKELRNSVARSLRVEPSDVWMHREARAEAVTLVEECPWPKVYDLCEHLYADFQRRHEHPKAEQFAQELRGYFDEHGIGWTLEDGEIRVKGDDAFERSVRGTAAVLASHGRATAASEMTQAIGDLSRRPTPDLTGAVHHAMAALEAVVRDVTGDTKPTLGELMNRYRDLIPKPLNDVVSKAWGYASERGGRHGREGDEVSYEEAELLVGLSGAVTAYLSRKSKKEHK